MRALLLLSLLIAACGKKTQDDVARGKALYAALGCKKCHRIGPEGGTGGPDLSYVGFHKSKEWLDVWLADPQAWKKEALMPNQRLTPERRRLLVEFLSGLKGEAFAAAGAPWEKAGLRSDPVSRGRVAYARAGCVTCHGLGGTGGQPNNNVPGGLIPPLISVSEGFTKEELKEKIRRGSRPQKADAAGPEPLIAMPAWGQVLKEEDLDALVAYLFSLASARPEAEAW